MQEVFDELRSALHTVWNRRWLALAVAWGVCILGWLAVAFIPNSYESRARIYVELEDVLSEQLEISGDGQQAITKVRQTLVSAVNLERVVRSTKLGDKVATDGEMQSAVQSLTENILVESEQDNLFEITATVGKSNLSDAENAALAKDVVQNLIDIFRESNIAGNRGDVADTIAFLDQQLDERKSELEAAEQRRLNFEAQHPDLIGGTGTVTGRLQTMRTEMRGIDADIRWNSDGSFHRDELPDLRADYVLANPPFNVSDWGGNRLREDGRWKFGIPPAGNANFAWLQHILHHLAPAGTAGVVLANGSMSSTQSGEGEIRQAMVEGDVIDCMIAMPGQLFYSTQIPVCLWFLAKDKSNGLVGDAKLRDRRGQILFIDARKLGHMVDRTRREFSDEDIARITDTYHAWREGQGYQDVPGFAYSASHEEVAKHGYVLTPGRYVGAEDVEGDGVPFAEKFATLQATLEDQFDEGQRLTNIIREKLLGLTVDD